MSDYSGKSMKFEKKDMYRTPWSRMTEDEKEEIIEKVKKRKEEAQRKKNILAADVMRGKQKTIDNSW